MIPTLVWTAIAVLGGGSGATTEPESGPSVQRAALVAAAGQWRPLEARPSGGFAYAGLLARDLHPPPADGVALALVASRIASRAAEKPSATSLADLGVLCLLQGQPGEAVAALEKALPSAKEDPALLNDLAAAYLTRADSLDNGHDLMLALDTLERALAEAPLLQEAHFNRALALEKLGLRSAAARTWTGYLTLDPKSGWADEARRRMDGLAVAPEPDQWTRQRPRLEEAVARGDHPTVEAAVREAPAFARRDALDLFIPRWAKARGEKRPGEAAASLAMARSIGEALARALGDEFVRDVVREIDRATERGGPSGRRAALVGGHLALDLGRSLLAESHLEAGVEALAEAEKTLAAARSPLALKARCVQVKAAYVQAKFEPALRLAEDVRREAARLPYPALRAEAARWVGLIRSVLGRPAEAIEAYRAALAALEAAGSHDDVAAVKSLLAENLAVLGADADAWVLRVDALRAAEFFLGTGGTYNIAFEAAGAAVAAGHPHAALPFLDAAVRAAEASGNRVAQFEILMERSTAHDRLGRFADAVTDRVRAREVAETLNDGSLKSRLRTESLLIEGELQATHEPAVAIGLLSRAASSLEEIRRLYLLPRLYRVLARAYRESGQARESEHYLDKAITAGETQSDGAPTTAATRRDPQRAALAEMVRLQFVALGDPGRALEYAERARSWRLGRLLAASRGQAIFQVPRGDSFSSCGARVVGLRGQAAARIEYFVLPDRILAWLVTADGLSSAQTLVDEGTVAERVGDLLGAAEQGLRAGDLDARLERVYDLLVRPLRHLLPDQARVHFVPDSALEAVPFGALRDRDTGRYLIEDHEVAVTSSAHCAAEGEPAVDPPRRGSGTFVVGDPAFDRRIFPWLSPLSGAAREAREVSGLHPDARQALGEQATKSRFLQEAAGATIVHFAGHVLGNQDRPELSMLVFAPDGKGDADSGALYARDVVATDLSGLDLVVLSACGTGLGPERGPVGLGGLAWSFLASGVRQVVTAVWRVEDAATSDFMIDFHRRLQTEPNPAAALRQAQLEWIRHSDRNRRSPAVWGGFTVVVSNEINLRPSTTVASKQPSP